MSFILHARSRVGLLLAALAITLSGCEIDDPLSDPAAAKADERLLGRWAGVATRENPDAAGSLLFIGKHAVKGNPDGIMEALMVDYDDQTHSISDPFSTRVVYFSTTKIGTVDVLNLFFDDDQLADLHDDNSYGRWARSKRRSVLPFRYVVEGDQLKLCPIDGAQLGNLATAGKVKRSTRDDDYKSAAAVLAYLTQNGADGLFAMTNDVAVFKRAK